MASSIPATSYLHSRRSLLETTISAITASAATPPVHNVSEDESEINAIVFMVLAVIICTVICALVLYTITQKVIKITKFLWFGSELELELPNSSEKGRLVTLPILLYSTGLGLTGAASSECAICLSEFMPSVAVRVLPRCSHGFHVDCIDRWLESHVSCPNCRQCLPRSTVVPANTISVVVDNQSGCWLTNIWKMSY
ncbi:hypothetical protein J5N97_020732 [Dioscorea zingiberensis]|uniref:RING-type domain-containing protein n=1 Tax=Dioscorea zingiberensis TaxID=325984 RepID=A0A9D5CHT3_9LILI|nr:hypothetical protein J5N97_020732 [Dioscorea zingiberensis]